jgi:ribosomal protein S18 acetylase RimI-like enzyme
MRIHRNEWIWGKTWVIVCEDGSGIIKVSQDPEDGVILSGLSVLPENRNQGIGTSLIKEAERIVRDEIGEEEICLSVESWNKNLIGWYERLGYSVLGPGEDGYTVIIKILNGRSSSLDLSEKKL